MTRAVLCGKRSDRQSSTAAMSSLHWRPAKWRIQQKLIAIVSNVHSDKAPTCIASWFTSYVPHSALRSSKLAKDANSKVKSNYVFDYLKCIIENNDFPETIIEEEYSENENKNALNETKGNAMLFCT
jgi:hypothetical protein